ncbi:MAG TPA: hypothetical protein VJR58_16185 [Vineibacter sp.]|nr:hypothetical protein [Vineibacter sp.]
MYDKATRNLLIIRDVHGAIIGVQVEDPADSEVATFISPAKPEHALHRVSDVPAEICNLADPAEFHRAITGYLRSDQARVTRTSFEELNAAFYRALMSRRMPS